MPRTEKRRRKAQRTPMFTRKPVRYFVFAILFVPVLLGLLVGFGRGFRIREVPVPMTAPIQIALMKNAPLKEVQRIINQNPRSIDMLDAVDGTAMDSALTSQRADVVQLLLEKGWDPNRDVVSLKMKPGNPLGYAVANGQWEIAQLLLDHGADPKKAAYDGLSGEDLSRIR